MKCKNRSEAQSRDGFQKLNRFRPRCPEFRGKIMRGRTTQPRQTKPHSDLNPGRAVDRVGNLVDFLQIICGEPPAAEGVIRLVDLTPRLDRIVIMELRPRRYGMNTAHLMDGGYVEPRQSAARSGKNNVLTGVGLYGIGNLSRKGAQEFPYTPAQRLG
jgi:hypothetical protein